jgi:hypothetical protein
MERIDLAWNRNKWLVLVNVTMNLQVAQNGGYFFTS